MTGVPRVSVIMNCRNGERYLAEAIESVEAQDFSSWEIVFFDNQSADGSAAIAQRYPGVHYVRSSGPLSLGLARTQAVCLARGDLLAFLDVDDAWTPGFLSAVVERFDADPQVALVYSDATLMDEAGRTDGTYWQRRHLRPVRGSTLTALVHRNPVILSASAARADAVRAVGAFRDYRCVEEYDLWLRLASKWAVDYVSAPLARHRLHANSETIVSSDVMFRERLELYAHWASDPAVPPDARRAARGALVRVSLQHAAVLAGAGRDDEALAALRRAGEAQGAGAWGRVLRAVSARRVGKAAAAALRVAQRRELAIRSLVSRWL